jgi:hypothetical protein
MSSFIDEIKTKRYLDRNKALKLFEESLELAKKKIKEVTEDMTKEEIDFEEFVLDPKNKWFSYYENGKYLGVSFKEHNFGK